VLLRPGGARARLRLAPGPEPAVEGAHVSEIELERQAA
jgi:hypothetical protein